MASPLTHGGSPFRGGGAVRLAVIASAPTPPQRPDVIGTDHDPHEAHLPSRPDRHLVRVPWRVAALIGQDVKPVAIDGWPGPGRDYAVDAPETPPVDDVGGIVRPWRHWV